MERTTKKIMDLAAIETINDEDILIIDNGVETCKVTVKEIADYINENPDTEVNVQSDWNETDASSDSYIKNKPTSMTANGGNADTVNGHTVNANVPANAEFTDTIYTHPNSDVIAGTYKSVTVNDQGHVINGSNPTTLSGYGITDAATKSQGEKADTAVQSVKIGTTEYKSGTTVILPDYPTALPASDVYEWAKSETKPAYTAYEVGADEVGSANTAYENAKSYTDDRITQLIGTSPENLDTIEELGDAISGNQSAIEAINNAITNKANVNHNHDELYAAKNSEHMHANKEVLDTITLNKVTEWDNKSDFDGDYNSLKNAPPIPLNISELENDAGYITANDIDISQNHVHSNKDILDTITSESVANWNLAKDYADSEHAPSNAEKNIIIEIQKNGTSLIPDAFRTVNIVVPTKVSELVQDMDFILINQEELTFTDNVATISDDRITADSLADVYFTSDTIDVAKDADISVETATGSVVLTATTEPTGIIKATIRIRVVI